MPHDDHDDLPPTMTDADLARSLTIQRDRLLFERDLLVAAVERITDITASDDKDDSKIIQTDNVAYSVLEKVHEARIRWAT